MKQVRKGYVKKYVKRAVSFVLIMALVLGLIPESVCAAGIVNDGVKM